MVTPPKRTLRRLRLEELISKMEQIEEQVALTLNEYPHGHTIERQRLVLAIARQIRSHLQDQMRGGQRVAVLKDDNDAGGLRVIQGQKTAQSEG